MFSVIDEFLSRSGLPSYSLILIALLLGYVLTKLRDYFHAKWFMTPLHGLPSSSLFFGQQAVLFTMDPGAVYEQWVNQYGSVFRFPRGALASDKVVVTDLKAISSFLARDTWKYAQPDHQRNILLQIVSLSRLAPLFSG